MEGDEIDCIHADQLTMTQFAFKPGRLTTRPAVTKYGDDGYLLSGVGDRRPILIFDAHNAVWTIVERMYETMPPYLRPMVKGEAGKVKYYEGMVMQMYDHILAVTEIDRNDLLEASDLYLARREEKSSLGNGYEIRIGQFGG